MFIPLYQVNKLLLSITELTHNDKGSNKKNTINELVSVSVNAERTNPSELIEECKVIELIKEKNSRLKLTKKGKKFFELRTLKGKKTNIDLNEKQKYYFQNLLFDIEFYKKELKNILKDFRIDYRNNIWFYPSEFPKEKWNKKLVNYLFEINFWKQNNNRIEITQSNSFYVSKSINKITRTEAELYKILEEQRKIGSIAEELTIKHEKNRLIKLGFKELSLIIQQISKNNVFAGYDVLSFNGPKSSLNHDRMIEVKGTKGDMPVFYWSKNEINVAKQLGDRYWIYIWTDISSKNTGTLTHTIRNPYKKLIEKKEANVIPVLYFTDLVNYQDK